MEDKTKEHIESLYERIKYLEGEINTYKEETLGYSKINQTLFNMVKHFEKEVKVTRDRKDYEFYREGMVKVVKQKDSKISILEKENEDLRCKIAGTNSLIKGMTIKVKEYV